MANFVTFRIPSAAIAKRARESRHGERADVRISTHQTTAQAIAHRNRLNGRGYYARQYQVTDTGDGISVQTAGGIRIRVK
jgi:hypothetical protein